MSARSTPPPGTADAMLDALDPEQREVASTLTGPLCVLAGPAPARPGRSPTGSPTACSPACSPPSACWP